MIDASFIIIAFNEEDRLERALRSISAQDLPPSYEILVVDDCSSDATVQVAERYRASDPATRVIRQTRNVGRGAARAAGVREAEGRYIAMVDADIVLPTDWYSRCVAALDSHDAVSGIPMPDGDAQYAYRRFGFEPKPVRSTGTITGNNALFRREVFEQVSFDWSLRNGEDVALSHALDAAGLSARTIDDLMVRHEEGKDLAATLSWMFESGHGATRQLLRYREVRPPDLAFLVWLLALAAGRRRGGVNSAVYPLAVSWAVGAAHLHQKFRLGGESPAAVASATAAGTLTMSAYFSGRLAALAGTAAAAARRRLGRAHRVDPGLT